MKRIIVIVALCVVLPLTAHAQFGNLLNNLKATTSGTPQSGISDVIGKAQTIATMFAQLPLNKGKMEFVKAAIPMLASAIPASKSPAGVGKVAQALDQVKGLFNQKMDPTAITAAQLPQAKSQMEKFSGMLGDIIKNEGGALKAMLTQTAGK